MVLTEIEQLSVIREFSGMGLLEAKRYIENRKLKHDIMHCDADGNTKSILYRLMPPDGLRPHEREAIEKALKNATNLKYPSPTPPPWKSNGPEQS